MLHLSPEFWAIIGVGFLLWFALGCWMLRMEAILGRLEIHLSAIAEQGDAAPWVANQLEPHISELGLSLSRQSR